MRKYLLAVACVGLLGIGARDLPAQTRFGVQGSWGDDTDFGIGGRVAFSLRSMFPRTPLEAYATFDYFFPDEGAGVDLTYWEINGNVVYLIPGVRGNIAPYVGGGLNIAHASREVLGVSASDTDAGLNLMGGLKFKSRTSRVAPFVELRVELGGGEQFVLTGGVLF